MTGGGAAGDFTTSQIFWNNGDGTFTDGTLAAGVGTDEDTMGLTIGDYDGDGQLDMFVSNLVNVPRDIDDHSGNRLFRNNDDRTFADQTDAGRVRDSGWSWGTTFLDYDNDGDFDLERRKVRALFLISRVRLIRDRSRTSRSPKTWN